MYLGYHNPQDFHTFTVLIINERWSIVAHSTSVSMIKTQTSSIIHVKRLLGYTDLSFYMKNRALSLIKCFTETSADTTTPRVLHQ